ncbi:MAG: radical SAM protein [Oscillospiraceae bacterium]|jgi:nitrogen fixation protein NifB|nr:radical SAM protein [Oscillospiraceae bacterium]
MNTPEIPQSLALEHPCFALGKPNNKGRIHLPVSPACNLECAFCSRSRNRDEQRPGVTAEILTPAEAAEVTRRALELAPEITVVGIAGPGDTLATPHAIETFRLVAREFPHLIKCLSTNGLLLPEKLAELIDVGVGTLTVTVNDVVPETLKDICGRVLYHGEAMEGEAAARLLIANQLAGIRLAADAGITVKVNTVLIPEVNSGHIEEIAQTVAAAGASVYNIIPLIPQNKLAHLLPPSCAETDEARSLAEPYIQVFRHCQHCRADAVGIPGGTDYGEQLYLKRVSGESTFSHG